MDIADRIQMLRGSQSREQFTEGTDTSAQTLYKYEKRTGKPTIDFVDQICKKFNICHAWLISGEGSMRFGEVGTPDMQACIARSGPLPQEGFLLIPLVTARLSAGCGCDLTRAKVKKMYSFRLDFLQRKGNPKDMVLMRVSGRSMEPEIWDGDIALLDTSKKSIAHEKILAVRYEDDIYIKRIEKKPNGVTLRSVNPEYAPAFVELNECTTDNFEVLGRVIWIGREYR